MAVAGAPLLASQEQAALTRDYRSHAARLVRQRSHIVLLSTQLETQGEIARVVGCSPDTVARTLARYERGGRSALRPRPQPGHAAKRDLAWLKALAQAMARGPQACGLARPTWTAPLLASYLAEQTGIAVSERTVRQGLAELDYVCRRPTWTVRHKAEAEPDYDPKRPGSQHS